MNYFDEIKNLEASIKLDYQKRFGKNDTNFQFFDSYLIGYYISTIATLLYELPEEKAKGFLKERIKGEKGEKP